MKKLTGTVISAKMMKTVTVEVRFLQAHPLYKKRSWKKTKYLVHDEIGVKAGDKVEFVEIKPISKNKKWRIIEVIGKKEMGSGKVEDGTKKLEVGKVDKKTRKTRRVMKK